MAFISCSFLAKEKVSLDSCAAVDEFGSLAFAVMLHQPIMVHLMVKMSCTYNWRFTGFLTFLILVPVMKIDLDFDFLGSGSVELLAS